MSDHTRQAPPNIVFILADDMGEWALGCSGNPEVRTPNLDAIAESGLRSENFFCASPVCPCARYTRCALSPQERQVCRRSKPSSS